MKRNLAAGPAALLAVPLVALALAALIAGASSWPARPGPGALEVMARWEERRARREAQLAREPENPKLRLDLAWCLMEVGMERALARVPAAGAYSAAPGDEAADRAQIRIALGGSPEFATARALVYQVLEQSRERKVRARAWRILAIMAARQEDPEETRWDEAVARRERAGARRPGGPPPDPEAPRPR